MKRTFGIVLVLLAVSATAVWAVAGFSDVPEDHPQAEDIQYAVDQGWFQGYPDGSFKPDRTLSTQQAVTVFGRAFPDGVSRADLATILRAGEVALNAPTTTTTATTQPDTSECYEQSAVCIEDLYWFERYSSDYVAIRFRSTQACSSSWSIKVYLIDENNRRTGDWGIELASGAQVGSTMTVEIRHASGLDVENIEWEVSCF